MARLNRDEQGSIIIMVMVSLVATGLIFAMLVAVESGMRSSRRAGDSANALQLADAGVNDAVRRVASATTPTLDFTESLEGAGNYKVTAKLDPDEPVWHIDAMGTDPTGVRRRVRADAVAETLFGNAIFGQSLLDVPSGASVDSFQSGADAVAMCTRNGVIGSNKPETMKFGNSGQGIGTRNCTESTYGISWPHPVDGCVAWGDGTQALPVMGTGKCPPEPATKRQAPAFNPPKIQAPQGLTRVDPGECSGTNQIIEGGNRYYWSQVTLRPGCRVQNTDAGPAVIYTDGPVDIGKLTGSNGKVNQPPADPTDPACPIYLGTDWRGGPASYYCPGWSGNLRIFVIDHTSSEAPPSFVFRNHTKFWGLIVAPSRPVDVDGGGNPQVEMWGAIITSASDSSAQFTFHFDDSLSSITTGRYRIANWREEPLSSG